MAVFFSFHYGRDMWRVQQVLSGGAVESQTILGGSEWEKLKALGDHAIQGWIDSQMAYKRAVVVLIGQETASRPWVDYEIRKAWSDRRRLLGIRIHGLADRSGQTDLPGDNPFQNVALPGGGTVADHVPVLDPVGSTSPEVHASIQGNLPYWVDRGYRPR